jgi:uncharacterized cupin superfamily protein
MADHPNVAGDSDVQWSEQYHGEKFGYRRKSLGSAAGGEELGCSLYEVPPGRRAWPYHYHLANEEAIYVLEGSGTLRIGGEEILVSEGDYVALPARAEGAHQLVNSSEAVLRYRRTSFRYLTYSSPNAPSGVCSSRRTSRWITPATTGCDATIHAFRVMSAAPR